MRRVVDAKAMTCRIPMVSVGVSIKLVMSAADLPDFWRGSQASVGAR